MVKPIQQTAVRFRAVHKSGSPVQFAFAAFGVTGEEIRARVPADGGNAAARPPVLRALRHAQIVVIHEIQPSNGRLTTGDISQIADFMLRRAAPLAFHLPGQALAGKRLQVFIDAPSGGQRIFRAEGTEHNASPLLCRNLLAV